MKPFGAQIRFLLLGSGVLGLLGINSQPAAASVAADTTVSMWSRFEVRISNEKQYADPFRDVQLQVRYVGPNGRTVNFWGFHDGDGVWRARFMPDRVGVWRYEAAFSDGTVGKRGSFRVVKGDLPGLVGQYAPNPIWFGHRGGGRLLVRSFHVGDRFFASNWDGVHRKKFLDWAQGQGYNTLSIASHYLNRNAPQRGAEWTTPALWPLNPAEYRKMEAVLDDLARRRIIVYPFAGFFGRDSNFPRDAAEQDVYIRYTLARLGSYWNLLYVVGGPEPLLPNKVYLSPEEVNRLGALIQRLDPFGHALSVHNATGDDAFRDEPWTSYGILQGPKTLDPYALASGLRRNHHPSKPLYAQETLWPGNTFGHPAYTPDHIRRNAFAIHFSAATLNYADMVGSSSTGFSGTMDLPDRVQSRHDIVKAVWDFVATTPFERMRPCQERVSVGLCLGQDRAEYLVYLPDGGATRITLPAGRYTVAWIRGRNTRERRESSGAVQGTAELTAPSTGDDWIVQLKRSRSVRGGSSGTR